MHRLIIIDRQDLIRSGLRAALSDEQDINVICEATNSQEALELCHHLRPDLIIMELHMPDTDGLDATRSIKKGFGDVKVLILSAHEDVDCMWETLRAGASGYLLKNAPRAQIVTAIRKVLEGETALVRSLTSKLLQRLASDAEEEVAKVFPKTEHEPPTELLKPRELQVLELMALGQTNRRISLNLALSEGTVKNHVQRLRTKLGAPDRTSAVVRAIELGIMKMPGL